MDKQRQVFKNKKGLFIATCVNCFTNKLWIPPLLLFCNHFTCVTGFVLTCMFCVQNIIISKCSYCLHNLHSFHVKQEKHFMESSKESHCTADCSGVTQCSGGNILVMYCLSLAQKVPQWAGWTSDLNSQGCAFESSFIILTLRKGWLDNLLIKGSLPFLTWKTHAAVKE